MIRILKSPGVYIYGRLRGNNAKRIAPSPNPSPFQWQTIYGTVRDNRSVYAAFTEWPRVPPGISFDHIEYFFNIVREHVFYLNSVYKPSRVRRNTKKIPSRKKKIHVGIRLPSVFKIMDDHLRVV